MAMTFPTENQTWLIETGHCVVEKAVLEGRAALTPWDRLIHCLWVADYGMCNAGDLLVAGDMFEPFQKEAAELAKAMGMEVIARQFTQDHQILEQTYFNEFENMCEELKAKKSLE